jgi:hypothetical protein
MKRLDVTSIEELEEMFKIESVELTTNIRDSIQEALRDNKKVAHLFDIAMEGFESIFQIDLPKKDWKQALENCLKHYEEWEMGDDALDTYLLIKELAKW